MVPPVTFSISGNAALPLTTLTLSGSAAGVTTADENGNYTFPEVPNGSYVVAPSLPGYAFRPPLVPVLVSAAPVSGINFMALRIPRVSLSWAPSVSPNKGYFVYRGTTPGGPYLKLNANLLSGTTYDDSNVDSIKPTSMSQPPLASTTWRARSRTKQSLVLQLKYVRAAIETWRVRRSGAS